MKEHLLLAKQANAPALQEDVRQRYSRRGEAAAAVERIVAALSACITLLYERDDDNRLCNVDALTGDTLVPLAWTSATYATYGLTRTDADVIRAALLASQDERALFLYDAHRRRWRVNLTFYPDEETARAWLHDFGWTLRAYRNLIRTVKERRRRWREK